MSNYRIGEVVISEDAIRKRNAELVAQIASDYTGGKLILIGILRGSFVFLADLVREFSRQSLHPRIDFMATQSYVGTESSGEVKIAKEFTVDVNDAEVILIDDILDTGNTLKMARAYLHAKGAANVKSCVLLDKPARRQVQCKADYAGFRIENHFVVGYGLDCDGLYRELPYIAKVEDNP